MRREIPRPSLRAPVEPGAKPFGLEQFSLALTAERQSQLLSVCLLRKYLARNRLRNLAVKDEIAALLPPPRESLAMTNVIMLNGFVLANRILMRRGVSHGN